MKKYKPTTKEELQELVRDESIYLGDIDTSLITDMSGLFAWSGRKDFSGINEWDTSNVTDMSSMFFECKSFNQSLSFDTSNVTNMNHMFIGCENFNQRLDFNTSKVKAMSSMFCECKSFNQSLSFDTSNVTEMEFMFCYCENFNQPVKFNTKKVVNMLGVFYGCKNFKQKVKFDMSSASYIFDNEHIRNPYANLSSLKKFTIAIKRLFAKDFVGVVELYPTKDGNFVLSLIRFYIILISLKPFLRMYKKRDSYRPSTKEELKELVKDNEIYLGDIDTSLITDMSELFAWSDRIDFNGIEKWDTSNVKNMSGMFHFCFFFDKKLKWNTCNVVKMSSMFRGCFSFNQVLDFDTSSVTDMDGMFYGCDSLEQLPEFYKRFCEENEE